MGKKKKRAVSFHRNDLCKLIYIGKSTMRSYGTPNSTYLCFTHKVFRWNTKICTAYAKFEIAKLHMKSFLLVIYFHCTCVISFAQIHIGKVKADPSFTCKDYSFVDPIYGTGTALDTAYGIPDICTSPNEVEIRLTTTYGPTSIFEFVILSFNGKEWTGKKYQFNLDPLYLPIDTAWTMKEQKVMVMHFPTDSLTGLFDALKRNHVFTLPDLKDIGVNKAATCGVTYILSFKAGNLFRTYSFNNTDAYMTKHPGRKKFKNYDAIIHLMNEYAVKK